MIKRALFILFSIALLSMHASSQANDSRRSQEKIVIKSAFRRRNRKFPTIELLALFVE
jgi:hypothetical protein